MSLRSLVRGLGIPLCAFVSACIVVPNEEYGGADETSGTLDGDDGGEDGLSGGTSDLPSPPVLACGDNAPVIDPECPSECDWCSGDTCVIRCGGKQVCEQEELVCPPGHPCRVECDGERACKEARVQCPAGHECYVGCQGTQTCEKLDVECSTGTCELGCGIGHQTCKNANLACGGNSSKLSCLGDQPGANVLPGPDGACACELGVLCDAGGSDGGEDEGDDDD